jgi:hypothetical protein
MPIEEMVTYRRQMVKEEVLPFLRKNLVPTKPS